MGQCAGALGCRAPSSSAAGATVPLRLPVAASSLDKTKSLTRFTLGLKGGWGREDMLRGRVKQVCMHFGVKCECC